MTFPRIEAAKYSIKAFRAFRIPRLPYGTWKFILRPSDKKIVYTTTDASICVARATLAASLRSAQKLALAENDTLYVLGA